jgi:aspartyl-tRNA(Asn)/glutamyl-tRNA(Gln) amidotransferase subunit A
VAVTAVQPHTLTAAAAADALRRGELSAVELTRSCLDRIAEVDDRVGAFVVVLGDSALAAAEQADAELADGRDRGPLHGIPVAVKDLYDIAGVPTTASSAVRADFVAAEDSAAVARLRNAGAIIVGKTHTHEFAYGCITPTTRNPWDLERVPGGSSGGSGAAIAAGECLMALGSDTGGSIRIPASLCGTVGLKPTFGRTSRHGVTSLSWSLDHVGPLTRTVRDAAAALGPLAGADPRDPSTADVEVPDYLSDLERGVDGLVVGVPTNHYFDLVDREVEAAVRAAVDRLADQGARVVEVDLPYVGQYMAVEFGIILPEASAYHQEMLRSRGELYTDDVRLLLETGELILATDYIKSLRVRTLIQQGWRRVFEHIDVLAAPTLPATAVRCEEQAITWPDGTTEPVINAYVRLSCPGNLTGLPALTVPCGADGAGLPIGLQLIGRPFDEATVLRVGHLHETLSGWDARQPQL